MKGKASKAGAETVISFSLTDSEVNMLVSGFSYQEISCKHCTKSPHALHYKLVTMTKEKKRNNAKLAQLQSPLLVVMVADPVSCCPLFSVSQILQLEFQLTLKAHQERAVVKSQNQVCSVSHLVPCGIENLSSMCAVSIKDSIFLLQWHFASSLCVLSWIFWAL